ncbi:cytochrome P450 2C39-like isoform X2 [Paramacrobiotus metropolitanus]|uniref:cytochrome P450 2C39-like isoform X2 n=1 Tax=Paramacrobiotus metropolitanus TaxID=2943436 RepID=UPI0024462A72|nr:cytochrome P450 2C39-like isoform X2 [Paramacrobiotus metropolitanus]
MMQTFLGKALSEFYSFPALISLIAVLLMFWFVLVGRPMFAPPGPLGVPIFGYAPFVGKYPWIALTKLKEAYGQIVGLYLGSRFAVVLEDYDTVHTAFVDQGDVFAGRGENFVLEKMATGKDGRGIHGITAMEGPKWKDTREFIVTTLHELGAGQGKQKMEKIVLDEVDRLSRTIAAHNAWAFNPRTLLRPAMASIMAMVLFSRRFQYEGDEFRCLMEHMPDAIGAMGSVTINAFHWLRYIPGCFKRHWNGMIRTVDNLRAFVENEMTNREKEMEFTLIENSTNKAEPKDFLDAYFRHINSEGAKQSLAMTDGNDFVASASTMFIGGTESTTLGLQWLILLMCRNPVHQQKIQEEMNRVIGHKRFVGWDDRDDLPLTTATFLECLRLSGLSAGNIPRRNLEATELLGYKIPKHSLIFANIWSIHNDPQYFPDPLAFKPDRFLDGEGNVNIPDQFMPFSIGQRSCPGQALAQMALFLTFANLVHRFEWKEPKGATLPRINEFGPASLAATPAPYKVHAVPRFTFL